MPLLSIITVAAFDTQRLDLTLKSTAPMLSESIEHIVVCPKNDIETSSLIAMHIKNGNSIRVINDSGLGIYPAMNLGILNSESDYCWFINCGDEIIVENIPEVLQDVRKFNPTWFIVKGIFDWRDEQQMTNSNLKKFLSFNSGGFVSHQTVIVRTSLLRAIGGFDTKYEVAADTKMLLQLRKIAEPIWIMKHLVRVEQPAFASKHNRRARFETLKLAALNLNLIGVCRILSREFKNLQEKASK